jgi:hypothetical protein
MPTHQMLNHVYQLSFIMLMKEQLTVGLLFSGAHAVSYSGTMITLE